MAPKKANRSPFGLFMTKMKRSDRSMQSMHVSQLVGHCAPLYDALPQEVRKRLDELSQFVRNSGLNDYEINRRLDQFSLQEKGVPSVTTAKTTNQNHNSWHDHRGGGDSLAAHPPPIEVGFNSFKASDTKRFKDNSFDSDEEVDTFFILKNAFKMTEDYPKAGIVCICFNVLVHTHEDQYYPNEVGITRFTLEDGLQNCFTKLIANEVPSGYYATAKEFSEAYHKLPVSCMMNEDFEANYELLFHEVYDFMSISGLKDDKNRFIIFCKAEDRNGQSDRVQVMGCLQWLDEKIRSLNIKTTKSLIDDFIVLDLSDLLFLTIDAYCMSPRPKPLCIEALNRSIFDFHPDLRCATHTADENNFCALAVTKRTAFLFVDMLFALQFRPEFDIKPKPTHRPTEPENNAFSIDMVPTKWELAPPRPHRYYNESQSEPQEPQNQPLKRLERIGLGRGRLMNNWKNLQNN